MEDESDSLVADIREGRRAQACREFSIQLVGSAGGAVEAAQDVHQRAFAGAAGSHDGDVFVAIDVDGYRTGALNEVLTQISLGPVGPTLGVGGPAGSKEAAKRCTEAIGPVGPTLKE